MNTTEKTSHKLGANRKEAARKRAPRLFSESRDVREDRGQRQAKFSRARQSMLAPVSNISHGVAPAHIPPPGRHLLAEHASPPSTKPTRLRLLRSGARSVCVAGTFNHWEPQALTLKPASEGDWETELALPPGDYEYRFIVDGEWTDDPVARRVVANPYGGVNAILHVHGG